MSYEIEKQIIQLLPKIRTGNVALFLGAGCSIPAGLLDGKSLTKSLKENFPDCNQDLVDFMDVCQDIEETPPYDITQLHNFIKQKLDLFQVTEAHRSLTKFPWAAIFTTNFDNIIETAYSTSIDRFGSCFTIASEAPSVNISDRSKVYLLKIMGTIDANEPSSTMVLTRTDYHNSILKRNHYLKLLADFIKSGTIIYIGYSFKDQIVKDIIYNLTKIYGPTKIPWSYMIVKDPITQDPKTQLFFSSNRIIPISGDLDSFFNTLDRMYWAEPLTQNIFIRPKATLNVHGKQIHLNEDLYNMYSASFDFLHEEAIQNSDCNIDSFLHGKNRCWKAFEFGWDFKRSVKSIDTEQPEVSQHIKNDLNKYESNQNKILYVTGMPGCGKTIYTNRIAFDTYSKQKVPVLLFTRESVLDFKLISSFIEDINKEFEKLLTENENNHPIKVMLVFDDVSSNLKDVIRLNDFLISRGRGALFVVNGRINELQSSLKTLRLKVDNSNWYQVDETLTGEESERIIHYLFEHKFITSTNMRWQDMITKSYSNSFFATFYSLVHPSRKPLDEIIRDQFLNLDGLAKEAFLNICSFSQFDISINIELVVRSLDISYEEFYSILDNMQKIIFQEEDYNGNVTYKTHHRIIAQKTLDFFSSDKLALHERYCAILKSCLLFNNKEREIVEKLLIENFSARTQSEYFTLGQRKELFIAACYDSPSRSVKHHLGLIEMELGEYQNAEDDLLDALDLPRETSEMYKGESDQNILTSLGKLNSQLAIQAIKNKKKEEAENKLKIADEYFNDAKHGDFPNAYAYHANAYMWFQKENIDQTSIDKAISISKSLEIIQLAKDNLNANELTPLLELETHIWSSIGNEDYVKSLISTISTQHNSAAGYFIYSNYLFRKASISKDFKDLYYNNAIKNLRDGLSLHPHDERCLALLAKLLLVTGKSTNEQLFQSLSEWKSIAQNSNASLLFHYARLAFILGYYDLSKEVFQELEDGVGMGNLNRSRAVNEVIDDTTGNPKVYSGEVTNLYSKYDGNIRVTSITTKINLKFIPVAAKFTVSKGIPVKFNIGFNYRGPLATNIIKT